MRGFAITTIVYMLFFSQGCFPSADSARMSISDKGKEMVGRVGDSIPKPGDDAFVGPPALTPAESFSEGKASAARDFNKTVSWATSIALWIFIPLAILVALASFVVPWIPTKAAIYCAVSACAVVGIRYALLAFGVIAIDWAVYLSAAAAVIVGLFVGLPLVISWVKRKAWTRGVELAAKGEHVEASVALLATVDPAIDKARKQVDEWLEIFHKGDKASSAWTEAKMQLTRLGVLKAGE